MEFSGPSKHSAAAKKRWPRGGMTTKDRAASSGRSPPGRTLLDRPGWGAWGAVVEIALRRMAGLEDDRKATVGPSIYPVALVTPRPAEFTRTALVLRGPGTHRIGCADVPGLYRRIHEWQLMAWVTDAAPPPGTPPAERVWRWAFWPTAELRKQSTDAWFGESDEPQ